MSKSKLTAALAAIAVGGGAGVASAAHPSFQAGDWTVTFDGNVNGFLTYSDCDTQTTVQAGLACTGNDTTNVNTGLLPAKLGVAITRSMNGYDTKAYVSFWPGVDTGGGLAGLGGDGAFGLNAANFRQVYLSFGNDQMGTIKVGRDLGVFASEAILNDHTLLGVGAVSDLARTGGNTTLGGIGTGYIYADWNAQVQYITPKVNGAQATFAITDPWDATSLAAIGVNAAATAPVDASAVGGDDKSPGFEAELKYSWSGPLSGAVWTSGFTQRVNSAAINSEQVFAGDVGGKVSMAGLTGIIYGYYGDGIGTTSRLVDAFSPTGNKRESYGGYGTLKYKMPGPGTTLAATYAVSWLSEASGETLTTMVHKNQRVTAGIYHPLTSDLNLVLEGNWIEAQNHANGENDEFNMNAGAIIFF